MNNILTIIDFTSSLTDKPLRVYLHSCIQKLRVEVSQEAIS